MYVVRWFTGSEELESSMGHETLQATFVSARKHVFESDANSRWTDENALKFSNNLREVSGRDRAGVFLFFRASFFFDRFCNVLSRGFILSYGFVGSCSDGFVGSCPQWFSEFMFSWVFYSG